MKPLQLWLQDAKLPLLCLFYAINLYYFYGVIIWNHSQTLLQLCHGYWSCNRHLSFQFFGWEVDLGDSQWKSFHNNFFLLAVVAVALSGVNALIRAFAPDISLKWVRLVSGLVILFVQHGLHGFIIIFLAGISFSISWLAAGTFLGPYAVWASGLFILTFKESYRLLPHPGWSFLRVFFDRRYGGMHGWQFAANFLILRVISFGIDLHRTRTAIMRIGDEKREEIVVGQSVKDEDRVSPAKIAEYDFVHFMTYVVYAPLYLAGPIVSFQDFIQYDRQSQSKVSLGLYALRFAALFILMEWCTARFPVFALVSSGLMPHMRISDVAVTFYVLLKLMWLKFTTLWRFFRLWSLADGVFVDENMERCMSNNYSLEQFWRGWHSSFNKWIIRYMYIPWGGRSYRWVSVWFIFLFVALWHDVEWKLIVWGLLNGSFYVLENAVKWAYAKAVVDKSSKKLLIPAFVDHVICSVSGAVYIMVLMVINLVGYALGTGTFHLLQQKVFSQDGLETFAGSIYFLSVGVSIMISLRHYKLCTP